MLSEFCAGHRGPQTHVELSVHNDITSSVEAIYGNVTSAGACCREGTSSYAGTCTQETRSFRSVMSTAKYFRTRTATGRKIARALCAVAPVCAATTAARQRPKTAVARLAARRALVPSRKTTTIADFWHIHRARNHGYPGLPQERLESRVEKS